MKKPISQTATSSSFAFLNCLTKIKESSALQTALILLGLSLFWLAMILIADPRGEFPLNDDWVYARSVFTFLQTGIYKPNDSQAAVAFIQIFWGALFSKVFGFSMTILRVSVIVLGWFGVLASYFLFQKAHPSKLLSALCASLLASTPLYFLLANTFMTNIPFCAFVCGSLVFLIRYIESEKWKDLVWGIALACCAVLIRQLALFLPIAFALAYWVKGGLSWRKIFVGALACLAVAGTLYIYTEALRRTVGLPTMVAIKGMVFPTILHMVKQGQLPILAWVFCFRLVSVIIYLGLFLLPLQMIVIPSTWKNLSARAKKWNVAAFVGFVFVCFVLIFKFKAKMPLLGVYFNDFSVGPRTIQGAEYLYTAPVSFWLILTQVGVIAGALLMVQISDALARFFKDLVQRKDVSPQWATLLCLSACFIHFTPLGLTAHFDLYISIYFPFMLFFLLTRIPRIELHFKRIYLAAAWMGIFFMGWLSVAMTHDYMSWNAARWQGLFYLMKDKGIAPTEIDGGYEFNGWFLYDEKYQKVPGRSWWWVQDDRYLVSFGPKDGYKAIGKMPYRLWLPPFEGNIMVSQRIEDKVARDYSKAKSVYYTD